jgi:hypothetical protein
MSAQLGAFWLLEIDGSHQVLFTRPAELAEAIIAATSLLVLAAASDPKWT